MSDVIHRTNRTRGELDQELSVSTPSYSIALWIVNPDLSGLAAVPKIYWKVVGDLVVEMGQVEKDSVDAALLSQHNTNVETGIKARLQTPLPLNGLVTSVVVVGLVITVSIDSVLVNDQTTVVADPSLTKMVKVFYIYDQSSDTFAIQVFEKTDGVYGSHSEDEQVVADFGEWSVIANGTDLVPV